MAPRIYSHSVLEAAVCEAKLRDALKVRYGKEGPARQGQLGHAVAAAYMTHLNRTKQPTDFEAGARMWAAIRHQASPQDEAAVSDSITAFVLDNVYQWVADAQTLEAENRRYFTIPDRREVHEDRVMELSGPVFRITPDLIWRGDAPVSVERTSGNANVLDWKWHRIIEHVDSPDQNRQLLRYASALFGPDEGDVGVFLGFPRKRYYEGDVYTPDQRRIAWDDLVVKAVADAEAVLSTQTLEPDRCVGPHCRHCDLRRGCDAALRYPFDLPMMETASAQERLTAFALVDALRKDHLRELKDYVNESGVVVDDDLEADITASEHMSFDRDTIKRVLGQVLAEEDIEQCFRATKTQTLRILTRAGVKPAQREEYIDMMRVTAERKLVTKIGVTKVKKHRKGEAGADDDKEGSA